MSRPPRRPNPLAGEVWFIQREPKHPLVTAEIDEATHRTVVIRWLDDGALQAKASQVPARYWKKDLTFVEQVPT